jgi:hypothetical protein
MLGLTEVTSASVPPNPRPMLARSIAAALLLTTQLIVAFLLSVAFWQRLTLLREIRTGLAVAASAFAVSDGLILLGARASIPLALMTAVAFLVWLHRASENLPAFRSEPLEFTPGQAVGSFFIPFINLIRPYEVMREVWQASDPGVSPRSSATFRNAETSRLVIVWWLLFLVRNVPGWWVLHSSQAAGSPLEKLTSTSYGALIMYVLTVPAAVAAIALVYLIDRRQDALVAALALTKGEGDPCPGSARGAV